MNHALTIMDGFHPDAQALRARVLKSEFGDQTGPDGAKYTNISLHPEPALFGLVEQAIGYQITPKLSFFRLDLAGELPHCAVHSDDICATHASVFYLNPPEQCRGGTAFWRHKELGLDNMPHGVSKKLVERIVGDWKQLEAWEMAGFVGMKFNRYLTYPTPYFHSRWPQEGFGTGKEDGRLVWVCFYDINPRYSVR